jgi:hypothetical protein
VYPCIRASADNFPVWIKFEIEEVEAYLIEPSLCEEGGPVEAKSDGSVEVHMEGGAEFQPKSANPFESMVEVHHRVTTRDSCASGPHRPSFFNHLIVIRATSFIREHEIAFLTILR